MPVYPRDPVFRRAVARSRALGDAAEVSILTLGSHAGTHIDVPVHFVEGGADLSSAPLAPFIGPCVVADMTGRRAIEAADVNADFARAGGRVLFKTDNSALWRRGEFAVDYTYLAPPAAQTLAGAGVRLVGIDYLSIERYDAAEPEVHRILLGAGVMILEGCDLSDVAAGEYFLSALPLAVAGGDGSPVRAVLLKGVHAPETA